MHELSIAAAVVSIAERSAQGRRVAVVELAVGELRQVAPSALELAFELCAKDTPVEGAELRIESIPVEVACRHCAGRGRAADLPLRCPRCGGLDIKVVAGEELHVEALELEEEIEPTPVGGR